MAIDIGIRRSRRSLLTAAGAAVGGAVVASVAGVQRVLAAGDDGKVIHVGDGLAAVHLGTLLAIYDLNSTESVFTVRQGGQGVALDAGANHNAAVAGRSTLSNGVEGRSNSNSASGVYGENLSQGYGVAGRSNAGANDSAGSGVLGENTAGGVGVLARSAHGVALVAEPYDSGAIAFRAKGVTQFARSGTLTVKAGTLAVTRTGIRVDPGTLVVAVLQQDRPGVYVRSAVPNASGSRFTIRLNKAVSGDTKVGWFLVN